MGVDKRQQAIRAMRGQIWSPGWPATARCEDRVRFWKAIARGASSEDAAGAAGVSPPVGSRWFGPGFSSGPQRSWKDRKMPKILQCTKEFMD